MSVGTTGSPDSLSIIDVRKQGGGIKEEYFEDAVLEQPEVLWYADSNGRRPYPGVGAFYAEVPSSLLSDNGGRFTRNQIVEIVERHMKAGGYAVVDTYGTDPVLTSIVVASGSFVVGWPSYGESIDYNALIGPDADSLVQNNASVLADNALGNSYTFSGLIPSTKYYMRVDAIDSGITSRSEVIADTTDAVEG